MGKTRKKSRLKRIAFISLVLLALYILLYFMTPSVSSYYYEKETDKEITGLETPMLTNGDTLILHTGFSLVYNEETEQASWVAYHLTRDELYGLFEREDNFRSDPLISTESAQLDDYRKSGYDRGHLIPAADATWSEQAMSDTFYLSNMSPQDPSFNRGIWADLEAVVRNFAATEGSVYVVTGPIFYPHTQHPTIGDNNVVVPDAYFKVILDYVEPEVKTIGFILENEGSKAQLQSFAVSVDEVEQVTQIDFFPLLENKIEDDLEASFDISLWDFDEFSVSKEERIEYLRNKESGSEKEQVIVEEKNTFYTFLVDIMMESKRELRKLFKNLDIEQVFGEIKGIFT